MSPTLVLARYLWVISSEELLIGDSSNLILDITDWGLSLIPCSWSFPAFPVLLHLHRCHPKNLCTQFWENSRASQALWKISRDFPGAALPFAHGFCPLLLELLEHFPCPSHPKENWDKPVRNWA